jgi:hypothetical protein
MTRACPNSTILLLSVSTIKEKYHDPTCEFQGGEHEFITRPSFVVYRQPEIRSLGGILKCVAGQVFIPKADLDQKHFARICAGVSQSPHRKPWAVQHFNTYA